MAKLKTDKRILQSARQLFETGGYAALSFDAIAQDIGLSKQAILYWFPSKQELLATMFVEWLTAEQETTAKATANSKSINEAIENFVRAVFHFHTSDIERFRTMYLAPQTLGANAKELKNQNLFDQVHKVTDEMYGILAAKLDKNSNNPRQEAVAIHSAVLGLVLMFALADGIADPLKHSEEELLAALIGRLT